MKRVTRENANVDRIACPWLIRRFIGPGAEFLFVPRGQVLPSPGRTPWASTRTATLSTFLPSSSGTAVYLDQ